MKWVKVFSVFVLLNVVAWAAAHVYKSRNPDTVLLVADTSFALKPAFPEMQAWISDYVDNSRYEQIQVGTDKAFIGNIEDIKSVDSIFRVSFGRSSPDSLKQYASQTADKRLFLTDGTFDAANWTVVRFPQ